MRSGGINFNNFSQNQLTKFSAVETRACFVWRIGGGLRQWIQNFFTGYTRCFIKEDPFLFFS